MGEEDKDSLGRSDEREHNKENKLCHFLRNGRLNVTENPTASDRDENGQVNSEFLFSVTLIGFRGSGEGLLNLSSDQEEEDDIDCDNENTRNEEGSEDCVGIGNIASSSVGTSTGKETV